MHVVAFSQLSGISLANSLWLSSLGRAWRSNDRSVIRTRPRIDFSRTMGSRAGENARSCHAFHHSIVDACAGLAMLLWALVSAEIRVGAMKKDV